jgi:uncharacterized protein YdeI (YjbR/CyaY-like superfamily)
MESKNTTEASDRAAWRAWLAEHHASSREVWLVFYKKGSGKACVSYNDAVEEALCFGWIDGVMRSVDAAHYIQRFSPRKPGSNWSRSNRERVQRLVEEKRMTPDGMALLPPDWQADPAKFERPHPEQNQPDQGESLPEFVQQALAAAPGLGEKFAALTPSIRRNYLNYILDAKREETRQKRLAFILDHVARGEKIDFMKPLK